MAEPRTEAIARHNAARWCDECSWVALVGSRTTQAFEGDIGMTPTGDPTTDLWRRVQREIMPGSRP